MGDYSKALSYYEKALAIRQQSLPPNHPDLAIPTATSVCCMKRWVNYSKARSFYERAVKLDNNQKSLTIKSS